MTVPSCEQPVDALNVDEAAEAPVRVRVTHLDDLGERMREPRLARIVQAALLGDEAESLSRTSDDFVYVRDLGLLAEGPEGLGPADPMYAEVLTRQLTVDVQSSVPAPDWPWRRPDGTLDFPALIDAWCAWWRANAAVLDLGWSAGYPEAVPHLVFLAFLQRVVNATSLEEGGVVDREFASGRGRIDLVVRYGGRRHLVELERVLPAKLGLGRVLGEGSPSSAPASIASVSPRDGSSTSTGGLEEPGKSGCGPGSSRWTAGSSTSSGGRGAAGGRDATGRGSGAFSGTVSASTSAGRGVQLLPTVRWRGGTDAFATVVFLATERRLRVLYDPGSQGGLLSPPPPTHISIGSPAASPSPW